MTQKRNAPGHKAEGALCLLAGDIAAYSLTDLRLQHLVARHGLPIAVAAIVLPFAFTGGRHA